MDSSSAATTDCANGVHDFMDPIVVGVQASQTVAWFAIREILNREIVVAFCRRCGKQTMGGWTEEG